VDCGIPNLQKYKEKTILKQEKAKNCRQNNNNHYRKQHAKHIQILPN